MIAPDEGSQRPKVCDPVARSGRIDLKKQGLRPHMFHELREGVVRLDPDLTRALAEHLMPIVRLRAGQAVEQYAKRLRQLVVPYRLVKTETPSLAAKRERPSLKACRYCKEPLTRKGLQFCGRACYLSYSGEVAQPINKARAKLAEMRAAGLSPGHGGEAARKRGGKIAESNKQRSLGLSPAEMRARKAEQMRGYRSFHKRQIET